MTHKQRLLTAIDRGAPDQVPVTWELVDRFALAATGRTGWLKECRRIFSRFEKTAKNFAGMIRMAFIHRYLRLVLR